MVSYPFAVLAALQLTTPRAVAVGIGLVAIVRLARSPHTRSRARLLPLVLPVLAVGTLVLGGVLSDDERYLLLLPVAINGALLATFARSLVRGPSMVETLATLSVGELTPEERPYCRRVTLVWCIFFVVNGALAATLAYTGPRIAWATYNGFLAYLGMGAIFLGERWVRARRFPWRFDGSAPPTGQPT